MESSAQAGAVFPFLLSGMQITWCWGNRTSHFTQGRPHQKSNGTLLSSKFLVLHLHSLKSQMWSLPQQILYLLSLWQKTIIDMGMISEPYGELFWGRDWCFLMYGTEILKCEKFTHLPNVFPLWLVTTTTFLKLCMTSFNLSVLTELFPWQELNL